jgi:hypothetical protein
VTLAVGMCVVTITIERSWKQRWGHVERIGKGSGTERHGPIYSLIVRKRGFSTKVDRKHKQTGTVFLGRWEPCGHKVVWR